MMKRHGMRWRAFTACALALTAVLSPRCASMARAQAPISKIIDDVGIDQRLDAQVPLDLEFRDEQGKNVRLGKFFGRKPVVLTLVYYNCPMLCTQVLNGVLQTSNGVNLDLGRDYEIVTVSFDARETHQLAAAKKARYVASYRRPGAERGWHFLTGSQASIDKLTKAVGFRYRFDRPSDQFAHSSGIVILTPEGRISRYFYGIEYPPKDFRFGLIESSAGKIGSAVDQFLLLCYHYDPKTGRYGWAISGVLRVAGSITVLSLGAFLAMMFRDERRRSKSVALQQHTASSES